MEEELRALYRLQRIDLELDELNEGGGDLPSEIETLEQRASDLATLVTTEETKLRELRESRQGSTDTVSELRERLRNLNERLRTVRNNKEYEATTNEISAAEQELLTLERSMTTHNTIEANLIRGIETYTKQREESARELEEKTETLSTIHSTHADEIGELHKAKGGTLGHITEDLLKRYEHIRTAHHDAVVKVRKGACSGCYRALPPQMIVEMRRLERLFTCENCGRIVIDEEVADSVTLELLT